MKKEFPAHLSLLSLNILYGANHLLAKGVMPEYLGSNAFVFIRSLSTTILFLTIFIIFIREKIDKKDWSKLILTGFLGVGISQVLFFNGIALTSALNVSILMTVIPILTLILSYFILKEEITKLKISGIIVGGIGAIALITVGKTPSFDSSWGDLWILLNAVVFGAYLVVVKPLMVKYKPLTVVTYHFLFGSLFIGMFPLVWSEMIVVDFKGLPFHIWLKMGYIIIGATFITYLLNLFALSRVSPSVSGSYVYTQPAFVMIFTFWFAYMGWSDNYSGAITISKLTFMFLIFLGVFLISKSTKNKT